MRFIAGTAGAPERLLAEAIRLARPGGAVALQEADISTLHCCPTHPAWDRLRGALEGVFAAVGADPHLGQRLFALVRQAGLEDVQYRPFLVGVRSCDPLVDYLPSVIQKRRDESALDYYAAERRRVYLEVTTPIATGFKQQLAESDPEKRAAGTARMAAMAKDPSIASSTHLAELLLGRPLPA